mmetsp:Transcript_65895/g.117122  ORF Transcript_65895/g.117122 Transcript_65895/m.117122 type:complete len:326 (+) Transcript_65895:81-1058(+)
MLLLALLLTAATGAAHEVAGESSDVQVMADCVDRDLQCTYWSGIGECDKNPRYMHVMCKESCRLCPGDTASRSAELYQSLEHQHIHARQEPSFLKEMMEVSYDPRVYVFDDFLTEKEAEFLMWYARPELRPSRTVNNTDGSMVESKFRKNFQMSVNETDCVDHPVIAEVIRRMHVLARAPFGHAEHLQVGRYQEGDYYEPHFDSEPVQNIMRSATVLVYLSVPEAGGETIFPKRSECTGEKFHSCCEDISSMITAGDGAWIPAKKRQALLFYSHDVDGRRNSNGMHASCPVQTGEKWIAQQWFRDAPYAGSPHLRLMRRPEAVDT